jgi:hypothetical protein
MVPISKNANMGVSSRIVLSPNDAAFFAPMPGRQANGRDDWD